MELKKVIKERHSVRKFSLKTPDWRDIIECIDLSRYSPMAGNNFSLRFVLVQDKKKIKIIADACQQDFVSQVHAIVVFCTEPSRTKSAFGDRGEKYLRQQAGAAIENFVLGITEKGLATCWVGHFEDDEIKEAIGAGPGVEIEAIFPIGYPAEKQYTKKIKMDLDLCLYFDQYKNKKMTKLEKLDV